MLDTVRQLGCLQLDPTKAVIQNHFLVLWSRLGGYDFAEFDRLMWQERAMFEYWAHAASIVLTEHYPIYASIMARHAQAQSPRRAWVEENANLRQRVLDTLRLRGAVQLKEIEREGGGEVAASWHSTGWTNGRDVERMVDYLWVTGEVGVAGRLKGGFRLWDIAERTLPTWTPRTPMPEDERVRQSLLVALNALGVGTPKQVNYHFTRYEYPNMKAHLTQLEAEGRIERVQIVGKDGALKGDWYVSNLDLLARIEAHDWQARASLLSPFDNLICDRARTEQLFDFAFRLDIYTPAAKRQYGYFVLPFLYGDALIGRIDPLYNRKTRTLEVNAVHWEAPPAPEHRYALRDQVEQLATWLGATSINGL
jgi:uncharacterized protein YcaQ